MLRTILWSYCQNRLVYSTQSTTVFVVYVCVRRFFFLFHFFVTAKSYGIQFIDVPIEMMCNKRVAELGNFKLHWSRRDGIHLVELIRTHRHIHTHRSNWARVSDPQTVYIHTHTQNRIARTYNQISNQQQQRYLRRQQYWKSWAVRCFCFCCSSSLFSNVTMRDYVVHMTLIHIDKAIQLNISHSVTHSHTNTRKHIHCTLAGCVCLCQCFQIKYYSVTHKMHPIEFFYLAQRLM